MGSRSLCLKVALLLLVSRALATTHGQWDLALVTLLAVGGASSFSLFGKSIFAQVGLCAARLLQSGGQLRARSCVTGGTDFSDSIASRQILVTDGCFGMVAASCQVLCDW